MNGPATARNPVTRYAGLAAVAAGLPGTFSLGRLALAAFQNDPVAWGIDAGEGERIPHTQKIQEALSGRGGCVARGLVVRVGRNLFRLGTPADAAEDVPAALRPAWRSEAYRLFDGGKKREVTFPEALAFWGSPRPGEAGAAVQRFAALLRDRDVPAVRLLAACHDYLAERFGRHVRVVDRTGLEGKGKGRIITGKYAE
jgi:hypothetical protein